MNEFEKYIQDTLRPEVIVRPFINTSTQLWRYRYSANKSKTYLKHSPTRRSKKIPAVIDFSTRSEYNLDIVNSSYNPQTIYLTNLSDDEEQRMLLDDVLAATYTSASQDRVTMEVTITKRSIGSESSPLVTPHDTSSTDIHSLLSSASLAGLLDGIYFSHFEHEKLKTRPASHYRMKVNIYQTYFTNISSSELKKLASQLKIPTPPDLQSKENLLVFNYTFIHKSKSIPYVTNKEFQDALVREALRRFNPSASSVTFNLNYPRSMVEDSNGCLMRSVVTNDVHTVTSDWYDCSQVTPDTVIILPWPVPPYQVTVYPYSSCLASKPSCVRSVWGGVVWDGTAGTGLTSSHWSLPWTNHHNPAHNTDDEPPPKRLAHLILEQIYVFEYSKASELAVKSSQIDYSKIANLVYRHRSVIGKHKGQLPQAWPVLVREALPNRLREVFKAINRISIKIPLYFAYTQEIDSAANADYFVYLQDNPQKERNRITQVIEKYRTKLPQKTSWRLLPYSYRSALSVPMSSLPQFPTYSYNFEIEYKDSLVDLAFPVLASNSYQGFGMYA